jgi:hypothetical protein
MKTSREITKRTPKSFKLRMNCLYLFSLLSVSCFSVHSTFLPMRNRSTATVPLFLKFLLAPECSKKGITPIYFGPRHARRRDVRN